MYSIYNNREDCTMRHENGNCLPCGGFCTAVNNEICYALQQAYNKGYIAGRMAVDGCSSCPERKEYEYASK